MVEQILHGRDAYGGHSNLALEAAADSVIDTLGLAPRGVDAHEPITLVASEAVGAYSNQCQSFIRRPGSLSFFFFKVRV